MNTWYLQRLRSMNWRELVYRAEQWVQSQSLKKEMGTRHPALTCISIPSILPSLRYRPVIDPAFDVLGVPIDPAAIDNWSYDVLTKKTFPSLYAKEINIRTDEHGSAKHVWEMNRMLFLPRLALQYRQTGDVQYITVIMRLISSWTVQNPYLTGINWYSNIEVNIRLINWFLTWEILQLEALQEREPFVHEFVQDIWIPSIYQHCKFSHSHPSLHSSANNHLIAEYAGLFIASAKWYFPGSSEAWHLQARLGLEQEIQRQHSANGVNKEEAAEYIQFITDFLLLSMVVGDRILKPFSAQYKNTFSNILHYIRELLTINGQFPKYGDEDDGRVFALNTALHDNNFQSLLESGAIYFTDPMLATGATEPDQKNRLLFGEAAVHTLVALEPAGNRRGSKFYPEEGHFIFRKQDEDGREIYCHFDAAPLGYLSIAAHGHADALSFVLYVDGQPVFVDPGTYCYHTNAEWRRYFVSTRAHNTICINGLDQAHFVGPTLWLNHYRTTVQDYQLSDDYDFVVARHNGYKKAHVLHTRKLEFDKPANRILITDHITNTTGRNGTLEMPFHLHPGTRYSIEGCQATLTTGGRNIVVKLDDQLQWTVVEAQSDPFLGWYSESFYRKTPAPVFMGTLHMNQSLVLKTELLIS
ncbi:alginate lyase family protein [Paraflavitalea sp. CAU 1676]|uniref:alginate lyase family protein n=1 Tax=Paraflavitalea sp. CAU 1676 TaxID=3032598 RepID=UPI0023DA5B04|nr:alginate lyase family protein [Paraflavitalea sp. CAU 1676]MDF2188459.1 alginate lyase family protein [Paraflavitalea sp. CAU 1676]